MVRPYVLVPLPPDLTLAETERRTAGQKRSLLSNGNLHHGRNADVDQDH